MKENKGFTLIELITVVTIIGILAAIAIPNFTSYRDKAYRSEGFVLAGRVKENVEEFFNYRGALPRNNEQAGVSAPEQIKGKYVESITVKNGTISVVFKNLDSNRRRGNRTDEQRLDPIVLVPTISQEDPTTPLIWSIGRERDQKDQKSRRGRRL